MFFEYWVITKQSREENFGLIREQTRCTSWEEVRVMPLGHWSNVGHLEDIKEEF